MRSGPEGWYQDPTERIEWRYWDGAMWTERVVTNGREAIDHLAVPEHEPPHWQDRVAPPVPHVRPHGTATVDAAMSPVFEPGAVAAP